MAELTLFTQAGTTFPPLCLWILRGQGHSLNSRQRRSLRPKKAWVWGFLCLQRGKSSFHESTDGCFEERSSLLYSHRDPLPHAHCWGTKRHGHREEGQMEERGGPLQRGRWFNRQGDRLTRLISVSHKGSRTHHLQARTLSLCRGLT